MGSKQHHRPTNPNGLPWPYAIAKVLQTRINLAENKALLPRRILGALQAYRTYQRIFWTIENQAAAANRLT